MYGNSKGTHVLAVLHTLSHKDGEKEIGTERERKTIGEKGRETNVTHSIEHPRKAEMYIIARQ